MFRVVFILQGNPDGVGVIDGVCVGDKPGVKVWVGVGVGDLYGVLVGVGVGKGVQEVQALNEFRQ